MSAVDREFVHGEPVYRDFDQAALDREYSPSSRVPDIGPFLREYTDRSAAARAGLEWREIAYGPDPAERLDFFPAAAEVSALRGPRAAAHGASAPLVVFIHGGYWQQLSKEDSAYPAPGLIADGIAYAALGYGLAPAYRLSDMVGQVRRAVRFLADNAGALGIDPDRIVVSGFSAGAHLAAMTLLGPEGPVPPGTGPRGAVLLSGVYDLAPVRLTYVDEPLKLTADDVRDLSPQQLVGEALPPLRILIGEHETGEFHRQHHEFVDLARSCGTEVTDAVVPGRNHFDLPMDLGDPDTLAGRAVRDLLSP